MILSEIIKDIDSEDLKVYFGSNILIDGRIVKNTINRLYGSWECLCINANDFKMCFLDFNTLYSFNLSRKLEAFEADYNPLENYNSNILEEWSYGEKNTANNIGKACSTSINGAQHSTTIDSTTTADDTTSFKNRGKTENNIDAATNTTSSDARTDTIKENARTDKRTLKQSGNIGVTTSQQMAESSLVLFEKNPRLDYITSFVNMYCYYFG